MNAGNQEKPSKANAKKAMKEAIRLAGKLGAGAGALLSRLKKDRSPEAMIRTLDEQLGVNQSRRREVSGKVERIYGQIAEKKKKYASAPKARQRVLEAELRSLLATYKAAERELNILLENERNLSLVRGRLSEVQAYGMAGVSEETVDRVIDEVEESVSEAEDLAAAARDLEKAGKRREREEVDIWAELEDFGPATESPLGQELSEFESEEDQSKPERKREEPPEA